MTPPPLAQRIALGLMHATQVATPFHRPGWVYEEKVDGYRMRAYKVGASVQLVSRQGKKFTQRFPDLARAVAGLGAESAILDTEVAVFVGVDAMRTVSPDVRTKISATRQARYGKEAVAPTR